MLLAIDLATDELVELAVACLRLLLEVAELLLLDGELPLPNVFVNEFNFELDHKLPFFIQTLENRIFYLLSHLTKNDFFLNVIFD